MLNIKASFDKVLAVVWEVLAGDVLPNGNLLRPGPKPRFSDIEVVALSMTAECLGYDSENYLFAVLHYEYSESFPNLISRRQFNDRRKSLFPWQEKIRSRMAGKLNALNEVYAIDSMPLEICKLSRQDRNKMGKDDEHSAPDKGFCASQNKYFYGYKIHAVCSPCGVIQALDLSKASVHDVNYLKDVKHKFKNCIITGDRGYVSKNLKAELWEQSNICLEVPQRGNMLEKKKVMYVLRRIRKRIETVFSQLCGQFKIQINHATSYWGYKTRILAKISGMTVSQYINKFINNRPVGQVKYALC